jgi:hypothetical protein
MAVLACAWSIPGTVKKAGLLNLFLFHAAQDCLVEKKRNIRDIKK